MKSQLFTLFYLLVDGTDHLFVGCAMDVLNTLGRVNYTEHTVVCQCGTIPVLVDDGVSQTLVCLNCKVTR